MAATHRFTLHDGRTLACTWFGAPRPQPQATEATTKRQVPSPPSAAGVCASPPPGTRPRVMLHFHGFLSSGLEAGLMHEDAERLGLSVLAVDRPGHGGSTYNAQQTVESTASDVVELLDGLGLGTVLVQGASGGAPYACATAALLGDRAAGLLLVCPLMPAAGREAELLSGTSPSTLRLFHNARHHQWRLWATLHALRMLQRIPHGNLLVRLGGFAPEDRRVMEDKPHLAAVLQAAVREGLVQGVAGALQDLQVFYVRPSTLDLASLRCTAHIWQGGRDSTTPPAMARAYARELPRAELHLLEGEGHLSLPFLHNPDILGSIASV